MKIAIVNDNGTVSTYEEAHFGEVEWSSDRTSFSIDAYRQADGAIGHTFEGQKAKDHLIDFLGLEAVKKGKRIPKSFIRKGDTIRMIDHGKPGPGNRDYKTIEYVATENGDRSYEFSSGERFYLIERPEVELPTAPGSVVRVRLENYGAQNITLGNDGLWRGVNVHADAAMVKECAEVLEVIA